MHTSSCVNLLIAAATKIEEEAELEILMDDAGGSGGIPTSSAITAIGAAILLADGKFVGSSKAKVKPELAIKIIWTLA